MKIPGKPVKLGVPTVMVTALVDKRAPGYEHLVCPPQPVSGGHPEAPAEGLPPAERRQAMTQDLVDKRARGNEYPGSPPQPVSGGHPEAPAEGLPPAERIQAMTTQLVDKILSLEALRAQVFQAMCDGLLDLEEGRVIYNTADRPVQALYAKLRKLTDNDLT